MAKGAAWSEAEIAELIRLHSLMYSAREMAALLKRPSRSAILGKLYRLGLSLAVSPADAARRTSWTKERVALLRRYRRAGRTVAEIAERLGATPSAVRNKARTISGSEKWMSRAQRPSLRRSKPLPAPEVPRPPRGSSVPFLEAGRDHCRFPLWDGRPPIESRMVCGADTEPGWSYCRRHHEVCVNRRTLMSGPGL